MYFSTETYIFLLNEMRSRFSLNLKISVLDPDWIRI